MTVNDLPIVAFFKHLLDPFIIWSTLILTTWMYDEDFTSYYLVLVIITFFISTYIYERILIYRNWRKGRLLAYMRDTAGLVDHYRYPDISRLCHQISQSVFRASASNLVYCHTTDADC